MSGNANPLTVIVWWTPDCGFLHVETNPVCIGSECPDGVKPDPEDEV